MTLSFAWFATNGNEYALSGIQDLGSAEGYGVTDAVRGLDMPPSALITDDVPLQPGQRLRSVKVGARVVDLPIFIRANTPSSLQAFIRSLRQALDPTQGDGRLRITPPDGNARDLFCRYAGQWTGDLSPDHYGVVWQENIVTLQANDPYFYATAPTIQDFSIGAAVLTFLSTSPGDTFLPLALAASTVLGDVSVSNTGDVLSWPTWTITGPGSNIILTNLTTNKTLEVDTTLGIGDQLVIDTRPGLKTVTGPGGVNLFGSMNATSVIWSLPVGASTVRVAVTGATTDTLVRLSFTTRYLGL